MRMASDAAPDLANDIVQVTTGVVKQRGDSCDGLAIEASQNRIFHLAFDHEHKTDLENKARQMLGEMVLVTHDPEHMEAGDKKILKVRDIEKVTV